jgi:Flp pilus assembly pilin Flp
MKHAVRFLRDEQGQDLVEYALIVAAVALAMLATLGQLASAVDSMYQHMIGQLTGVDWSNTK